MYKKLNRIWSSLILIVNTFRNYWGRFLVMIFLGFFGGLFGSIGISAIIPLFSVATNQTGPSDFITKSTQTFFNFLHIPFTVPLLLTVLIVIFVAKAIMLFIAKYYNDVTTATYEEETRKLLLSATLRSDWPSLSNHKVGYVDRVILYDVQQTADSLNQISASIFTLTTLVMYTIVAIRISLGITLTTLVFGGILFFIFKPLYYKARKLAEKISLTFKFASHKINESLIGAKTIKISGVEEKIIEQGNEHFTQLKLAKIRIAFYGYLVGQSTEPVAIGFIAALFLFSYRQNSFNIIVFAVTMYIVQKMFTFVQSLQSQFQNINQSIPYLKVVSEYGKEVGLAREIDSGNKTFEFKNNLRFKNVTFRYANQKEGQALEDIVFTLERGSILAILGPSGSGKTTIVDNILRLFKPDSGEILIDELNIEKISLESWRQHIGYVPQDTFLINDTIENNIRFYDNKITSSDITESIKAANLEEFISRLPEGLKTMVGERGVKLSGGQRQRIALARALARKPAILILDEATSALDNESESLIREAIEKLRGKITIIVIAHRFTTIAGVDNLLVINNGKIIESGKPEELLKNNESYFSRMSRMKI